MAVSKVDNSFSASDALRRYAKASSQAPWPYDETGEEGAPKGRSLSPVRGIDRVTISALARRLLAGEDAPPEPAMPETSRYTARALPAR